MDFRLRCNLSHGTRYFGFIPVSLVETDKYIKVADGHFFIAKQTGEVWIEIRDETIKPFIATLYKVLLGIDLCYRLFYVITLMNLGHTWLFHKGFCTVLLSDNEQNAVTLPHSAQRKHAFLVKMKGKSKSQKKIP